MKDVILATAPLYQSSSGSFYLHGRVKLAVQDSELM